MGGSADALSKAAPGKRRWSDLGVRAISGLVLIAVAILTARQGGILFVVTWLAAAIAVFWEWQRFLGTPPAALLGVGIVALVAAAVAAPAVVPVALLALLVGAGAVGALAEPGLRVWAVGGLVYAGLLVVAVAALRPSFPFGSHAVIWLFATVWSSDVFAYFGGRLVGGPKLWPAVSPSKTWSGTMTGLAAGALIGTFVVLRDPPAPTPMMPILLLSFAAAALSQVGDAFESAIKRRFNVKDSGSLIPGHGGVMDRLDGFIAAAVFAFLFGLLRGQTTIAGGLFYWP